MQMGKIFVLLAFGLALCAGGPPYPLPPFECPSLSDPQPSDDVRKLRPGNVKVVMAMGDSITAGFAMVGHLPEDLLEYRGRVYSIGGVKDQTTIPNWLRHYSKDLQGDALGDSKPMTKGKWLDAGVSMAKIEDILPQVDYLVQTMKTEYAKTIDFENDWKLLTLFIGANDLCMSCKNSSHANPAVFESSLRNALDKIHTEIPRVFVNVLTIFNISGVWEAGQTKAYCRELWAHLTAGECPCLTTGEAADRQAMDVHSVLFNHVIENVTAEYAALNDPNFTVVAQPGVSGFNITFYGEHYLSTLDCFHPSLWANQAFTLSIWNNMLQPLGQKATTIDPTTVKILCPDENTYLQ